MSTRKQLSSKQPEWLETASASQLYSTNKYSVEHAKEITERIAVFVAWDLQPISVVDGDGFNYLMKYLEPEYRVPFCTRMSKIWHRLYETEKSSFFAHNWYLD